MTDCVCWIIVIIIVIIIIIIIIVIIIIISSYKNEFENMKKAQGESQVNLSIVYNYFKKGCHSQ